ncbi:MAG: SprT-like domain-containing protein [Bacteroidales bacterium]|nr:SprT-like domain-containing protein [Bacteroidales bacterium]
MIATIPFLEKRFETFNTLCFSASLAPVPIKLSRATRSLGACTYKKQRKLFGKTSFSDFCIRISTCFDLPENELEDILLHEMIHYEILSKQLQDTSAHGRLFRSRMNEINERLGRHITVSHRLTPQTAMTEARPAWRVVARVRMKDGRLGVKVLPRIVQRLKAYRRGLLLSGEVAAVDFFWTDDPYFSHFPKSSALNVFFPGDTGIEHRFATARPIDLQTPSR